MVVLEEGEGDYMEDWQEMEVAVVVEVVVAWPILLVAVVV